jgi:GGDEF domain-containing protein
MADDLLLLSEVDEVDPSVKKPDPDRPAAGDTYLPLVELGEGGDTLSKMGSAVVAGGLEAMADSASTIENVVPGDWYRNTFVTPAELEAKRISESHKASDLVEEYLIRMSKTVGHMGVQIPIDSAIGAAILSTLPVSGPAALTAGLGYGTIKALRYLHPFAVGMFARRTAKTASKGNVLETMYDGIHNFLTGGLMSAIPSPVGKGGNVTIRKGTENALGWGAFNVWGTAEEQYYQALDDIKAGRPIKWTPAKEWLMSAAEGLGISALFIGSAKIREAAYGDEYSREVADRIHELGKRGRYNPELVSSLIHDPLVKPEVQQAARELEGVAAEELAHTANPTFVPAERPDITKTLRTPDAKTLAEGEEALVSQVNEELRALYEKGEISEEQYKDNLLGEGPEGRRTFVRGPDRRDNEARKKRSEEFTKEELVKMRRTDDLTNSPNKVAFEEAEKKAVIVQSDAEGLKAANDLYGDPLGDEVLKAIANAHREAGADYYRLSGDTFVAMFDSIEQAHETMGRVRSILDETEISTDTSPIFKGGRFTYGVGTSKEEANMHLIDMINKEIAEGIRPDRGKFPKSWRMVGRKPPKEQLELFPEPEEPIPFEQALAESEAKIFDETKDEIYMPDREIVYTIGMRVQAADVGVGGQLNWGNISKYSYDYETKQRVYRVTFRNPDTGRIVEPDRWYTSQELKGLKKIDARLTPKDIEVVGSRKTEGGDEEFKVKVRNPLDGKVHEPQKWLTKKQVEGLLTRKAEEGFLNTPTKGLITPLQKRKIAEAFHKADIGNRPMSLKEFDALHPTTDLETQTSLELLKAIHDAAPDVIQSRTQTAKETLAKAQRIPVSLAWFRDRFKVFKDIAPSMMAARMVINWSSMRLAQLKARTIMEDATPADFVKFSDWAEIHTNLSFYTESFKSELGRGLQSLQQPAYTANLMRAKTMEDINRIISSSAKGNRIMSAWVELFRGWMFGNPGTHAVNLGGNFVTSTIRSAVNYIAVGIGKVRNTPDRMRLIEANANLAGKVRAHVDATRYMVDMMAAATEKAKEGKTPVEKARIFEDTLNAVGVDPFTDKWGGTTRSFTHENLFRREITEESPTLDQLSKQFFDGFGVASRATLGLLGYEDVASKYINHMGKIEAIAVREAHRLQLEGEVARDYMNGFIKAHRYLLEENLRPLTKFQQEMVDRYVGNGEFHAEAKEEASELTYTSDFKPGTPGQDFMSQFQKTVGQLPILQFLFPTFKTPFNILSQITQHTPILWRMSAEMRADIKAGGRRRDLAHSKLVFGSMLYATGMLLYWNGVLAPGMDKDMRAGQYAAGVDDDAVLIDGKSYPLQRYSPLANFLAIGGRMAYTFHNILGVDSEGVNIFDQSFELDPETIESVRNLTGDRIGTGGQHWTLSQAASYMMVGFSKFFSDVIFLGQLKSFLDAVWGDRGTKPLEKFLQRTVVGMTVPFAGALRFVHAVNDPVLREVEGFIDAYKAAIAPEGYEPYEDIPGLDWLADPLRPKYDIFGKPVPSPTPRGGIVPYHDISTSPVRMEILRLELPIQAMIDDEWRSVKLTPEEQEQWNKNVDASGVEELINERIQSERYKQLKDTPGSIGPGTKGKYIKTMLSKARRSAFARMNREAEGKFGKAAVEKKRGLKDISKEPKSIGGFDALIENLQKNVQKPEKKPVELHGLDPRWQSIIDSREKDKED